MKPRRWFLTPELILWRYLVACRKASGPLFLYPYLSIGMLAMGLIDPMAWFMGGVVDRTDTGVHDSRRSDLGKDRQR